MREKESKSAAKATLTLTEEYISIVVRGFERELNYWLYLCITFTFDCQSRETFFKWRRPLKIAASAFAFASVAVADCCCFINSTAGAGQVAAANINNNLSAHLNLFTQMEFEQNSVAID